ncbi:hypothetical protein P4O66_010438 [Electrophorus voltai]|uniref:BZIP domain-containing protein n=1 Tax=Electrophorus voltai TaxID=2609070 RepID=A0AAD9DWE5_9TELE|nr:hypothetical protein P4O66_010438 [Electrophorus voltai]
MGEPLTAPQIYYFRRDFGGGRRIPGALNERPVERGPERRIVQEEDVVLMRDAIVSLKQSESVTSVSSSAGPGPDLDHRAGAIKQQRRWDAGSERAPLHVRRKPSRPWPERSARIARSSTRPPPLTDVTVLDMHDEFGQGLEVEPAAPEAAGVGEEGGGGDARHGRRVATLNGGSERKGDGTYAPAARQRRRQQLEEQQEEEKEEEESVYEEPVTVMNSEQERPFVCSAPGCSQKSKDESLTVFNHESNHNCFWVGCFCTLQRFPTEDHLMIHRHKHEMTLKFPSIKNDNMLSDQTPTPTRFLKNCEEVGLFSELDCSIEQEFCKAQEEEDSKQNIALHGQPGPTHPHPTSHPHARMVTHESSIVIQQALPSPQSSSVITQAPSTNRQIGSRFSHASLSDGIGRRRALLLHAPTAALAHMYEDAQGGLAAGRRGKRACLERAAVCRAACVRPVPGSLSSLLHLRNRQRQPLPASMPGTLPDPTMQGSSAVLMPMERQMSMGSNLMSMQGSTHSGTCSSPHVPPMHSEAKLIVVLWTLCTGPCLCLAACDTSVLTHHLIATPDVMRIALCLSVAKRLPAGQSHQCLRLGSSRLGSMLIVLTHLTGLPRKTAWGEREQAGKQALNTGTLTERLEGRVLGETFKWTTRPRRRGGDGRGKKNTGPPDGAATRAGPCWGVAPTRLKAALAHHPGPIANGNMNTMGHMMEMMSSRQEQGGHHHLHSHPHQHMQGPPHGYPHHAHHHSHPQTGHHHPQSHGHPNSHPGHLHPAHGHQTSPHQPMHSAASQLSPAGQQMQPTQTMQSPPTSGGRRRRVVDEDPDERRRKFLERNRAAATRCRQKRKVWVMSLEKKAEELTQTNMQLQNEVSMLKNEVTQLKQLLLTHKDCPITAMQKESQGYLSPESSPAGSPTPVTQQQVIQHNTISTSSTAPNHRTDVNPIH